jgi:hypothetical protein
MNTRICHHRFRRLNRSIVFSFLVLALVGSAAGEATAQTSGAEQIRAYIERTEELLIWAKGLVSETQSVPARKVLGQAADLHRRSMELMSKGHLLEALGVSRRSRAAMGRAVGLAREAMGLEERIRIRVERFRDQYGQLMERAQDAGNRQAIEFLRRSERSAIRAREQFHQGDFKLAWKMLEQAGDLMRRAARLLADGASPERLELEMDRTMMLIERTRDGLGDDPDPQARKLLAEAEEALVRARQGLDQGHPGRALQMTGLARRLALRAASLGGSGPDEEAVRRQLDRFDERSGRVADLVRDSGSKQARDMYERALQHRTRAAEAAADGEGEMALRQIRAAHDLLGQAEDLIR